MKKTLIVLALICIMLSTFTTTIFAAGSAVQPVITNRAGWSARAPSGTITQMASLNRAVIHHTANSADFNTTSLTTTKALVRAIQNLHMDTNGWSDIGYHFLTDKLGNTLEGRQGSLTTLPRGAHDAVNTNSFGFNVMGYFHTPYNQVPTTAQKTALYDVIAWRIPNPFTGLGSGTYNSKTVGFVAGHRDVGATACPGDLMYQYIGTNYSGGEARTAINSRIVGVSVIVDNTDAGFTASANWTASTSTPGYYGSNYTVRATAAVSDAAQWSVTLPSDGSYKVYAYWSAGANRSATAPYIITHTGGNTTVSMNQQSGGGQWNLIGTYSFTAGTAVRAKLSCWTTTGYYVVADAVKFVKQ